MTLTYKIIVLSLVILLSGCVSNRQIDRAELVCKYDGGLQSYSELFNIPHGKIAICKNGNRIKLK